MAKAEALMPALTAACEAAKESKRFQEVLADPGAGWPGWPADVAEAWLTRRPKVLFEYFAGRATPEKVGATLRAHFQNAYRPKTGNARGRPARVSTRKVTVPSAVAEVLDAATWDAMRQAGAVTDSEAARATLTANTDPWEVIASAGLVRGRALKARYTSIRGDLYWADVRNTLELWIMARPELVEEFDEWDANGRPRAGYPDGKTIILNSGRKVEHNPLIHIGANAYLTAKKAIASWRNTGTVTLDSVAGVDEDATMAVNINGTTN